MNEIVFGIGVVVVDINVLGREANRERGDLASNTNGSPGGPPKGIVLLA